MKFKWDNRKAAPNVRKHGVSFTEASTTFADALSVTPFPILIIQWENVGS